MGLDVSLWRYDIKKWVETGEKLSDIPNPDDPENPIQRVRSVHLKTVAVSTANLRSYMLAAMG